MLALAAQKKAMKLLAALALVALRTARAASCHEYDTTHEDPTQLCQHVVDYPFAALAGGAAANNAKAIETVGDGRLKATQVWLRLDARCKSAVKRLACPRRPRPRDERFGARGPAAAAPVPRGRRGAADPAFEDGNARRALSPAPSLFPPPSLLPEPV